MTLLTTRCYVAQSLISSAFPVTLRIVALSFSEYNYVEDVFQKQDSLLKKIKLCEILFFLRMYDDKVALTLFFYDLKFTMYTVGFSRETKSFQ